ncbi:MAG: hypothetical protein Q9213_005736 [Squamulea squamosa]
MSKLVHDSSKSLTSRLLGRLKDGLDVFVAPQASFAINCFAALSKCQYLRQLDVSHVSENLGLLQLLRSVNKLSRLEKLSIRCQLDYDSDRGPLNVVWPPNLKALQYIGPLDDDGIVIFKTVPETLTSLTLHHCPRLSLMSFGAIMVDLGHVLESFQFGPQVSYRYDFTHLGHWLGQASKLCYLYMPAIDDSVGTGVEISGKPCYSAQRPHPLEHLEFDCTSYDSRGLEMDYDDIFLAIAEGYLGRVRRVGFRRQFNGQSRETNKRALRDLDDLLRALAREDGDNAKIKEEDAGVYMFS